MASTVGGESSSSSDTFNSTPPRKYDVFLSFAGQDTRLNFTDHLHDAFIKFGISCFKDDVDLERGQDINYLFQAIEDSLCGVLVISQNYAKSIWCLNELQKIRELGRRIFPIFYNVNPADVRHQRGSFGEAWNELARRFEAYPTKLERWRKDLSDVGNLYGWPTREEPQANLIKNIVGDVWSFLKTKLPSFDNNLVGIDSKVDDVISCLEIGLDDKRFVGIWGKGGVGKTTLARVVFEQVSDKFEIYYFLEKVKDALLEGRKGLVSLQKSVLSRLQIEHLEIYDSHEGMRMIRKLLFSKKVLLVLDDIDDMSQLEQLAESPDWFGKGSRIIITTRDSQVLNSIRVERIYEMKTMKEDESLQIFSKIAFNTNHPDEKYLKYLKSVVKYAGGLPLALKALGSYLCGRSEEAVWRDVLDKLKQINPHKNILQVLKISYDGLDEKEQTIFLDIVCLFKHWKKEEVTQILKACDLNPIIGIKVLIEKSLLVETESGTLDIHDLYEDLGLDIIRQKATNSRLWKVGEIKEVLENNKGSEEIEAIVLEDENSNEEIIEVHFEAFSKMSRIRLLIFNHPTHVPRRLEKLSGSLKFVRWPHFPLEALPLQLDEVVHIEMRESKIKQLWHGRKSMNHLKIINLSQSPNLIETPNFSNVRSLEHLCLSRCPSLVKVHESLGVLKKLVELDLHGCENLDILPSKLETDSLRKLDLGGCTNVKDLPAFGEGMIKLSYLNASHTAITSLPESLGSLTGLKYLCLCKTGLRNLPSNCFSGLFGLILLSLERCESLESLPRLPPRLIRLEASGCYSMKQPLENLVTSLDYECRGQTKFVISDEEEENMPFLDLKDYYLKDSKPEDLPLKNFFAIMPSRGKIPSWFGENIEYYYGGRVGCEIEVNVPPNYRGKKWSGIVVCLHIKGDEGLISWSSKAPEDDEYNGQAAQSYGIWSLGGDDGLCIMVLEFNQDTCWKHIRCDNNSKLHIILSSYFYLLREKFKSIDILGCGWKVICEDDLQNASQNASAVEIKLPLALLGKVLGI